MQWGSNQMFAHAMMLHSLPDDDSFHEYSSQVICRMLPHARTSLASLCNALLLECKCFLHYRLQFDEVGRLIQYMQYYGERWLKAHLLGFCQVIKCMPILSCAMPLDEKRISMWRRIGPQHSLVLDNWDVLKGGEWIFWRNEKMHWSRTFLG